MGGGDVARAAWAFPRPKDGGGEREVGSCSSPPAGGGGSGPCQALWGVPKDHSIIVWVGRDI